MELLTAVVLIINLLLTAAIIVVLVLFRRAPAGGVSALELREAIDAASRDLRDDLQVQRSELREQSSLGMQQLERRLNDVAAVQAEALGRDRLERQRAQHDQQVSLVESLDGNARKIHELAERTVAKHDELQQLVRHDLERLRVNNEAALEKMRTGNEAKLEKMRETVDEKLQGTLEKRLGESFALVSERLEQVQKGLGEMQSLASDVGGLKRVLTNVKNRGSWGEVQLARQLEDILAPTQYDENVVIRPGTQESVEFAVRLPGRDDDRPVYLPIDSKFPQEDYERLLAAQETGDAADLDAASKGLERAVLAQAKKISEKYIAPPHSTDFAILYLPTEGLFAEVIRRPGLTSRLQNELRVLITGPTTLMSLLNSLQMGFRTLAIEKRSSEVWQVLSAAKTEFGKYAQVWDKLGKQLGTAQRTVEEAGRRTRAVERKLRDVEETEHLEPETTIEASFAYAFEEQADAEAEAELESTT